GDCAGWRWRGKGADFDYACGVVLAVDGGLRQYGYAQSRGDHVTDGFQRAGFDRGVTAFAFDAVYRGGAGFQYLIAKTVPFAQQEQAFVVKHAAVDSFFSGPLVLRRQ